MRSNHLVFCTTVLIFIQLAVSLGISIIAMNHLDVQELRLEKRKQIQQVNGCSDQWTIVDYLDDTSMLLESTERAQYVFAMALALLGYGFIAAVGTICGVCCKAKLEIFI